MKEPTRIQWIMTNYLEVTFLLTLTDSLNRSPGITIPHCDILRVWEANVSFRTAPFSCLGLVPHVPALPLSWPKISQGWKWPSYWEGHSHFKPHVFSPHLYNVFCFLHIIHKNGVIIFLYTSLFWFIFFILKYGLRSETMLD